MKVIQQQDLIASVADALQYISYFHPPDYIRALGRAYELEQSPAARDAIAQILTNSRMCAEGRRPICQDTGIVVVFAKVGMNLRWDAQLSFEDMINEGVRRAYLHPDNKLRASIVADPNFTRRNTRDNTPGGDPHAAGARRRARDHRGGQGRRLGEQVEVRDAESVGFAGRLGAQDRAAHGCRLVSAGHAGHRHRWLGRKGHAARQGGAHGADRHDRAQGARAALEDRGAAHRAVRQGQRARHRRPGSGRPIYRARREDPRVPDARGLQADRDDPELRRHAARAFHARRQRAGAARAAEARGLAERSTGRRRPARAA